MKRVQPLDVIAAVLVASSGRHCRNCRCWPLLTAADVRRVRRQLERVLELNAAGVCLWCTPERTRGARKREADRHCKPRRRKP